MTEYIYGDVLFIIDFSMDFLCLYLSGKILHLKMRAWRVISAAALGALYGVLSLLISPPTALGIVIEVLAAFLVCAAGLFSGGVKNLVVCTAVFYAISTLLGGVMTLIFTKLGKYRSYVEIGGTVMQALGDVPLWVFALCAVASVVITRALSRLVKRKHASDVCTVSFTLDGKEYEVRGLVDSGNLCADPISGTPVIFLSKKHRGLIPSYDGGDAVKSTRRIRIIPIKTASGGALVYAKKPERCYIECRGDSKAICALIAVGDADDYGGCDALVPAELI